MQVTIARQLGLDPSTVSNFFMNARRRSVDKWREDSPASLHSPHHTRATGPATLVQHIGQSGQLSPTSLSAGQLDLWQDLGEEGDSPTSAPTTVYIIPRDKLVRQDNNESEADYDSDHVILDRDELEDTELDTELDTEDDVDLDDDCLDPPD